MKFCKAYEEYMEGTKGELPAVGLKKLKKMLKSCRTDCRRRDRFDGFYVEGGALPGEENPVRARDDEAVVGSIDGACPGQCPVCDGTFFPSLLNEMTAVVGCFNERARKLVDLHLESGIRKYLKWFGSKSRRHRGTLIQEGKDLVAYAIINATAMRKILKKYDKVHYSKQGQAFKSKAQSMHIEILQSPWLCELMAFYINMRETMGENAPAGLFEDCSLKVDDDKPMLSCGLSDSVKLEIDLTCSICLDTLFDPVSLNCGHIFCYMCCCSSASVTTIDGLKTAKSSVKCPLCRQKGACKGAVHLDELNMLLSRSFHDYWEERVRAERASRIQQAKDHWDSQCRAFVGI